jgi:hypothetical protein
MSYSKDLITLDKRSLHPPALDAGDDEDEIPSVLLEYNAYVADRRNDTTAVAHSTCGREVQVSFFAARPPRVSYLCVFCRPAATEEAPEEEEEVELIPIEPQVLATDENLVLLRIAVSPDRDIIYGDDYTSTVPPAAMGRRSRVSRGLPAESSSIPTRLASSAAMPTAATTTAPASPPCCAPHKQINSTWSLLSPAACTALDAGASSSMCTTPSSRHGQSPASRWRISTSRNTKRKGIFSTPTPRLSRWEGTTPP